MNENKTTEMSLDEKRMCLMVLGEQPELPYPLRPLECADGVTQMEYEIPDEARERVLQELFFLWPVPGLDDEMFDLHERKTFRVRDYKVIRWQGTNILVSPYHAHSGGALVDWMPSADMGSDTFVMGLNPRFAAKNR